MAKFRVSAQKLFLNGKLFRSGTIVEIPDGTPISRTLTPLDSDAWKAYEKTNGAKATKALADRLRAPPPAKKAKPRMPSAEALEETGEAAGTAPGDQFELPG